MRECYRSRCIHVFFSLKNAGRETRERRGNGFGDDKVRTIALRLAFYLETAFAARPFAPARGGKKKMPTELRPQRDSVDVKTLRLTFRASALNISDDNRDHCRVLQSARRFD